MGLASEFVSPGLPIWGPWSHTMTSASDNLTTEFLDLCENPLPCAPTVITLGTTMESFPGQMGFTGLILIKHVITIIGCLLLCVICITIPSRLLKSVAGAVLRLSQLLVAWYKLTGVFLLSVALAILEVRGIAQLYIVETIGTLSAFVMREVMKGFLDLLALSVTIRSSTCLAVAVALVLFVRHVLVFCYLRWQGAGTVSLVTNVVVSEVVGIAPRPQIVSASEERVGNPAPVAVTLPVLAPSAPILGEADRVNCEPEFVQGVHEFRLVVPSLPTNSYDEMAFKSSERIFFPQGKYPKGVGRLVVEVVDEATMKSKYMHGGLAFLLDLGEGRTVLTFTAHQREHIGARPVSLQGPVGQYPIGGLKVLAYAKKPLDFVMLEVTPVLRSVTGLKALKLVSGLENFVAVCYGYDEDHDLFWESQEKARRYELNGKKQMHYTHWCTTTNGSSGAPLVVRNHGVVGIHIGGDTNLKDEPVHNLATTLGFMRQRRKLVSGLAKVDELYDDHRDNYLDYDEVRRLLRLNPDLDPNGYWLEDMYIPHQDEESYDDIDLEDLYDLDAAEARYYGPELKVIDKLRKQEFTMRDLIRKVVRLSNVEALELAPEFEQQSFEFVANPKVRILENPGPAPSPLFRESPEEAGVLDDRSKKTAPELSKVSEKLTRAIDEKLLQLEKIYSLDVSLERSIPYTKDLNRQLAQRLTQLGSFTKQLKVSLAGSKKKALDLSGSGKPEPSKAGERVKSKKNQRFSKKSVPIQADQSQKQLLGLVSQLVERLPSLPVSDSRSVDSKPVAKPLPQPLEQ